MTIQKVSAAIHQRPNSLFSYRYSRAESRGPGPLEVEASEMARDIHDFSDEEQAGSFLCLHRLRREFIGVDTAGCDLGFLVAFRTRRQHLPAMQLLLHRVEVGVGPALRRM